MGRSNTISVLRVVYGAAPKSVTMLIRELGLSRTTVERALKELIDKGYVERAEERGGVPQNTGRRPVMHRFRAGAGYVVGLEVGEHSVRAIVTNLEGALQADNDPAGSVEHPVPQEHETAVARGADRKTRLTAIDNTVAAVLSAAAVTPEHVWAVAAGTPGIVDQHGNVAVCNVIRGWTGDLLRTHLRHLFPAQGCDIRVENDANLAAVAEHRMGCVGEARDVVYVLAGRRIGLGIFHGGQLHRGATGRAGEIANIASSPWGRANQWLRKQDRRTAAALFHATAAGEADAIARIDDLAADLAAGLAEVVHIIDPQLIVIGGGLAHAGDILVGAIRKHLDAACRVTRIPPPVELSILGERGVVLGAVQLALEPVQHRLSQIKL
ncbi:MAG TPA: ROK family transcriptional regulator [Pseudonocardiaceae bacterium]|nr:ROK family transcriptional regulator [Pseudonocardiaceae bacterium]